MQLAKVAQIDVDLIAEHGRLINRLSPAAQTLHRHTHSDLELLCVRRPKKRLGRLRRIARPSVNDLDLSRPHGFGARRRRSVEPFHVLHILDGLGRVRPVFVDQIPIARIVRLPHAKGSVESFSFGLE